MTGKWALLVGVMMAFTAGLVVGDFARRPKPDRTVRPPVHWEVRFLLPSDPPRYVTMYPKAETAELAIAAAREFMGRKYGPESPYFEVVHAAHATPVAPEEMFRVLHEMNPDIRGR